MKDIVIVLLAISYSIVIVNKCFLPSTEIILVINNYNYTSYKVEI